MSRPVKKLGLQVDQSRQLSLSTRPVKEEMASRRVSLKRPASALAILDAGMELEQQDAAAATAAAAIKDEEAGLALGEALAVPAPAEEGSGSSSSKKGRPGSAVPLSGSQKVAFSRWCKKQSVSIAEVSNANELKSAWLLSPENAKSIIIKSTSSQETKAESGSSDLWVTKARIEVLENKTGAELEELISGLESRPSRFQHLRGKEEWREYFYQGCHEKKQTRAKVVKTDLVTTSDELAAEDAAGVHEALVGGGGGGGGRAATRTPSKPKTPKAPPTSNAKLGVLLKKVMKYQEELGTLVAKGEEKAKEEGWMRALVAKTREDHAGVKSFCRELAGVMADELNEEQVTVWEERVAGVMAKSSSVKLLKQACS